LLMRTATSRCTLRAWLRQRDQGWLSGMVRAS
jgi:hypothetical protein